MFNKQDYSKVIAINSIILSVIMLTYLAYIWSSLILPFVIAVFLSFWIISIAWFFKNFFKFNNFFSYLFSFFSFLGFFFLVWWIINTNISEITKSENIAFYQNRLVSILNPILDYLSRYHINEDLIKQKILKSINFTNLFWSVTSAITSILSNAGLIIIYIIFILLEHRYFKNKIDLITSNPLKKSRINSIIDKVKNDIRVYFFIKTIMSISTWFLSYFILLVFQVKFALFWAFSIFILNYIPTIGSIIAVVITSLFIIIQFWFVFKSLFIISWLIWVQILIWNIIEPKLMGSKLNLSPLVILIALWFWWSIWWVIWMLLSVPIMVIINIVLSKFKSTRFISVLLSEKWIIDNDEDITIEKTRQRLFRLLKNRFVKNR